MSWQRVSRRSVEAFLDFSGGRSGEALATIAKRQLDGTVALYNRLSERRVAWLADEVGMGKTYVALGVAALLRHLKPDARILILVPSSRLQPKWRAEIDRFTREVVQIRDHRARTLQDKPRPFHEPRNLAGLADHVAKGSSDLLAPMTAFSFALGKEPSSWREAWAKLRKLSPRVPAADNTLFTSKRKEDFKRHYAAALNLFLPEWDLVIVDESHNLKHGLHGSSSRNQTLAVALGGKSDKLQEGLIDRVQPKVDRLLCLSATPVESDYSQMVSQAELLGLGECAGFKILKDTHADDVDRRDQARRYVVRRLNQLAVADQSLTKNQYRREWRWGGVTEHDRPHRVTSDLDRLVLALVQKKVTEVLHETQARKSDGRFLRSFQMGMLSSFESFLETIQRQQPEQPRASAEDDREELPESNFDGDEQTKDSTERRGVDTHAVDRLCTSFRETFHRGLPHPKMDAVAEAAERWMELGEKSLVFVRRIKTVEELGGRIARAYDERLFAYLRENIHEAAAEELDHAIDAYRKATSRLEADARPSEGGDEDDEGGTDTFFAWYFRGAGRERSRAGAWFRVTRLRSGRWSIFFHDNPVRRLVGSELPAWIEQHRPRLEAEARRRFHSSDATTRHHFRYEAWQAAGIEILARTAPDRAVRDEAAWLRQHLFSKRYGLASGDIGNPNELLGEETLFTVLAEHPLRDRLWPRTSADEKEAWREREVRRELLTSAIRLGHPVIDLWLSAVALTGRLDGGGPERSAGELARAFLARILAVPPGPEAGMAGWSHRELVDIGENHDLIVSQNFSEGHARELGELSKFYAASLSRQAPVVGLYGSRKSEQALKQFRMPGYPYVLVTTDILQEGVDLHTFCGRIVHYGIAHTSSATEQRTGRVDRIGSLVQRRLAGELSDEKKLQVHYPHLLDTVEPLQVRVLYERMDRFVRLLHDGLFVSIREESKVNLDAGMRGVIDYPKPIETALRSPFEVCPEDLEGKDVDWEKGGGGVGATDLQRWLDEAGSGLDFALEPTRAGVGFLGEAWLEEGELVPRSNAARRQPFRVTLEDRRDGKGLRVRVVSLIGAIDLSDGRTAGAILREQEDIWGALFETGDHEGTIGVRADLAVEGADMGARLRHTIDWVSREADWLEARLLGEDVDEALHEARQKLDLGDEDGAE